MWGIHSCCFFFRAKICHVCCYYFQKALTAVLLVLEMPVWLPLSPTFSSPTSAGPPSACLLQFPTLLGSPCSFGCPVRQVFLANELHATYALHGSSGRLRYPPMDGPFAPSVVSSPCGTQQAALPQAFTITFLQMGFRQQSSQTLENSVKLVSSPSLGPVTWFLVDANTCLLFPPTPLGGLWEEMHSALKTVFRAFVF